MLPRLVMGSRKSPVTVRNERPHSQLLGEEQPASEARLRLGRLRASRQHLAKQP
jgi:hypothetical protein